jgi:hypothetical protein
MTFRANYAAVLVCAVARPSVAQPPQYSILDLGTFGGDVVSPRTPRAYKYRYPSESMRAISIAMADSK